MKKLILSILGVVGIFLATNVFAVGTATVKLDTLTVGTTLTLGSANLAKVPVMTDNAGTKFDSGTLTITGGSQTVSTSLTTVDAVFPSWTGYGSGSVTWIWTASTGTFTIQGYTGTTTVVPYTGTAAGRWLAFDE